MNASILFDTLTFSKRLVAAGCEQRLAEEQALAQSEIITQQAEHIHYLVVTQLATKEDVKVLRTELKEDIRTVKEDIRLIKEQIKHLVKDTKKDIKHLESTLLIRLGGLMTVLFGVGIAILRFT